MNLMDKAIWKIWEVYGNGDYSFKEPLKPGDKLVFCDMAHYSMVKNNTFNGINLPAIVKYSDENGVEIIRQFGYEDFRNRLS